jgi:hypothetical protein
LSGRSSDEHRTEDSPASPARIPIKEINQKLSTRSRGAGHVARKVLIASWHVLSLREPFKPSASTAPDAPASSSIRLAA